jgi:hypothetical protein
MVKDGQRWSNMVKHGQRWSNMVNFKFLTTFGEIPENPVPRAKVRLVETISTRAWHTTTFIVQVAGTPQLLLET